jgi:hypothetical protein
MRCGLYGVLRTHTAKWKCTVLYMWIMNIVFEVVTWCATRDTAIVSDFHLYGSIVSFIENGFSKDFCN